MDENSQNSAQSARDVQEKHLSVPVQAAFFITVCALTLLCASGFLGIIGFALVPVAAAMNVLLAFEYENLNAKLFLLLVLNLIPFVAAGVYFQSLIAALGALYPLMMALPIWLTVRMGYGRAASIASSAICAMLVWCASFVLALVSEYGAFNAETLGTLLDSAINPYIEYITNLLESEDIGAALELTSSDFDMLRYYFKTMLLGSVGVLMIIWSYFATLAVRLIAKIFDVSHRIPRGYRVGVRAMITKDGPRVEVVREDVVWRIQLDNITVAVYVAAYIVSVLFAPTGGVALTAYSVAVNLILILTPGFFYSGVRDIILSFRGRSVTGRFGRIAAIISLVLVFISPASLVLIFSALGVGVTLRENRAQKNIQKTGKE